jgi:fructokinase
LANDKAAEMIHADIRHWKLSDRYVRSESDGSTPIIVERISRDSAGRPTHSFSWRCPSCGARFPSYKPELVSVADEIVPKLKNIAVFFFDRVSAGALALAKGARDVGALVVFEPSGIGNPLLFRQAWDIAHMVKYSHQRLNDFPDMDIETNPYLTIETLGDVGLRYRIRRPKQRPGRWIESKAFPVDEPKDAAGAGDWCTAGILSRIAERGFAGFIRSSDERIASAIQFGQALATWNCRFEGARGGMYAVTKAKFRDQIDEILSGTPVAPPTTNSLSTESFHSSNLCRVCEPSRSHRRKA